MRQSKDKEKAKHLNNAFHLFCLVSGSSDLRSPVYILHVWFFDNELRCYGSQTLYFSTVS